MQEDPGSSTVRRSSWRSWAEEPRDAEGPSDDDPPEPASPAIPHAPSVPADGGTEESFDIELTWPVTERPLSVATAPAPVEPDGPAGASADGKFEWAPEPTVAAAPEPAEPEPDEAVPSDDPQSVPRAPARSRAAARRRTTPPPEPASGPLLPRLDARVASVETTLEGLATQLAAMASSLAELSEVMGAIEGATAAVADDVQAVRAEVVATRRDVAAAHDDVVAAGEDRTPGLDVVHEELADIKEELSGLRRRLAVRVKDPAAIDEQALAAAIAGRLADSFELVEDPTESPESTSPARRRAPLDARPRRSR